GQRLAFAINRTIRVWDATLSQELSSFKDTATAGSLAFSPDGRLLASTSTAGAVKVWNANSNPDARLLQGHSGAVTSAVYSPDGQRLVSGSSDGTVNIWDTVNRQVLHTLDIPGRGAIAIGVWVEHASGVGFADHQEHGIDGIVRVPAAGAPPRGVKAVAYSP